MLDEYKYEGLCLSFSMANGEVLRIIRLSSFEINDDFFENDLPTRGVLYVLRWNGMQMPYSATTQLQATAIALGCQWGVTQIFEMRNKNNE